MINLTTAHIAFFGTSSVAVEILEGMWQKNISPKLIVTTPDKPKGRKLELAPSPVKVWATEKGIPFIQPETLKDDAAFELLSKDTWDVFVVVSYGKIIPEKILEIPKHKTLNIHFSLLPKYRGASPVQSAILANDRATGVTIMLLDAEMDHGPVVVQEEIPFPTWPLSYPDMEILLAKEGTRLLLDTLPQWLAGEITNREQDHSKATYTKKFSKEDGLLKLEDDPYQNWLKICAFEGTIGTHFFKEKNGTKIRVKIAGAEYHEKENDLVITKVIPEGGKIMDYASFTRGY